MTLEIIFISAILVAVAGIGLAVKFYRSKNVPICFRQRRKGHHFESGKCSFCGMDEEEYLCQ